MAVEALLVPVLALQDPAAGPQAGPPVQPAWTFPLVLGICFAIFYVVVLRPQFQQDKKRRLMLEALKKKDRVLTSGGILGIVSDLREDEVTVRVCENPDVKIRIRRSAVVEVVGETAETPAKQG